MSFAVSTNPSHIAGHIGLFLHTVLRHQHFEFQELTSLPLEMRGLGQIDPAEMRRLGQLGWARTKHRFQIINICKSAWLLILHCPMLFSRFPIYVSCCALILSHRILYLSHSLCLIHISHMYTNAAILPDIGFGLNFRYLFRQGYRYVEKLFI